MRKQLLYLYFCTIRRVVSNHGSEVSPVGDIDLIRYLVDWY